VKDIDFWVNFCCIGIQANCKSWVCLEGKLSWTFYVFTLEPTAHATLVWDQIEVLLGMPLGTTWGTSWEHDENIWEHKNTSQSNLIDCMMSHI
jgi:hypothetical protein